MAMKTSGPSAVDMITDGSDKELCLTKLLTRWIFEVSQRDSRCGDGEVDKSDAKIHNALLD